MREVLRSAAVGLLLMAGAAHAAEPAFEKAVEGPIHYCGGSFSMDLQAGESIAYRAGPDFSLYRFANPTRSFGVFEGIGANVDGKAFSTVKVAGIKRLELYRDSNGGFSYVVDLSTKKQDWFVHLYGPAWQGNDEDLKLLSRLKIGSPKQTGCKTRTVPRR